MSPKGRGSPVRKDSMGGEALQNKGTQELRQTRLERNLENFSLFL